MEDLWNMCGKWMEHVQYENLWKCHYSSIPAYPTKHFETWEFDMVCLCSRMNTAGWINNGGHAPENVREASVMIKSKIKHMMPAEEISPHLGFQAKHDSKYSKVCRSGVPDNLRSLCVGEPFRCWVSHLHDPSCGKIIPVPFHKQATNWSPGRAQGLLLACLLMPFWSSPSLVTLQ